MARFARICFIAALVLFIQNLLFAAVYYDIDFSAPEHIAGKPPTVEASEEAISKIVFGEPMVTKSQDATQNQFLVFNTEGNEPTYRSSDGTAFFYDQIELKMRGFGSARFYYLSFDVLTKNLIRSENQFTIFAAQKISFQNNGMINIAGEKEVRYENGQKLLFEIQVDYNKREIGYYIDKKKVYSSTDYYGSGLGDIRFSLGLVYGAKQGDDKSFVELDNIYISDCIPREQDQIAKDRNVDQSQKKHDFASGSNMDASTSSDEPYYIPFHFLKSATGKENCLGQEKTLQRLTGLEGLILVVDVDRDIKLRKSPLDKKMQTIRNEITNELTEYLFEKKVPVVSYSQWEKNEFKPVLYVNYSFTDTHFNLVNISCKDQFVLQRNPKAYKYMPIWGGREMFTCETLFTDDTQTTKNIMLKNAKKALESFVEKYHEANPELKVSTRPQSLSSKERDAVFEFMADGADQGMQGLTCFLPAIQIRGGRRGVLNSSSNRYFTINDRIIKKYRMSLRKANIPVTPLSKWEKDPDKVYLKIEMDMSPDFTMFNSVLYDRYVLKRQPECIEYCNIWGYNEILRGERISQGKAMGFISSQSSKAFKEFVRAYRIANTCENQQ